MCIRILPYAKDVSQYSKKELADCLYPDIEYIDSEIADVVIHPTGYFLPLTHEMYKKLVRYYYSFPIYNEFV